jgi:tetratricopeptide (TPR) repeat protein
MTRRRILAVAVLVVPAWLMMPLENSIHSENLQLRYGGAKVTSELRDQIGQGMAIALLAGFRGVVADFLWIQSHDYWAKKEWMRQYSYMKMVTMLQPQSTMFWDIGAWHMAWNIGYAVSVDPQNRTQAEGIKREREWWDRARDYLQQGIENVPNRPDLYFAMGWLYWEKYKDGSKAQEYFHKAVAAKEQPQNLSVRMDGVQRLEARAMEKSGDVKGAYQCWKQMWLQDHQKTEQIWTVVEREVKRLEDELRIPENQRVFPNPRSEPASPP